MSDSTSPSISIITWIVIAFAIVIVGGILPHAVFGFIGALLGNLLWILLGVFIGAKLFGSND